MSLGFTLIKTPSPINDRAWPRDPRGLEKDSLSGLKITRGEGVMARGWKGRASRGCWGALQLTRCRGRQDTPDGGVVSYPRRGTCGLGFVALTISSLYLVLLIPRSSLQQQDPLWLSGILHVRISSWVIQRYSEANWCFCVCHCALLCTFWVSHFSSSWKEKVLHEHWLPTFKTSWPYKNHHTSYTHFLNFHASLFKVHMKEES